MDIDTLVKITRKGWALPILSAIHKGVPARQAPLLAETGASRTAFAQSLAHLVEVGMLEKNPGHGHPLRPEYRLTEAGVMAATFAQRIVTGTHGEHDMLIRRAWTVPILTTLHQPRYFNEIKATLPTITDRALSQSLKSMESCDWVRRSVDQFARPPRALYSAINLGSRISQAANIEIWPD